DAIRDPTPSESPDAGSSRANAVQWSIASEYLPDVSYIKASARWHCGHGRGDLRMDFRSTSCAFDDLPIPASFNARATNLPSSGCAREMIDRALIDPGSSTSASSAW